ncbi:MAG: hypothetical protein ACRDPQ_18735 [Nocardioidaceae bacterium]
MSFALPSPKQVIVAVGLVAGFYGATVLTSPVEDEPAEPKHSVTVDRERPEPTVIFAPNPDPPSKPMGITYLGRDGDPAPR